MNVLLLFDSNYAFEYVKFNAFYVLFMGLDACMFGVL